MTEPTTLLDRVLAQMTAERFSMRLFSVTDDGRRAYADILTHLVDHRRVYSDPAWTWPCGTACCVASHIDLAANEREFNAAIAHFQPPPAEQVLGFVSLAEKIWQVAYGTDVRLWVGFFDMSLTHEAACEGLRLAAAGDPATARWRKFRGLYESVDSGQAWGCV